MSQLPTVEARKIVAGCLLWRPDSNLLQWWGRSTVKLLLLPLLLWLWSLKLPRLELRAIAPVLLLLWLTQLTSRRGKHHAVLRRGTARTTTSRRSEHHLLPLLLISRGNSLHHPFCLHHPFLISGCTCQLIVQVGEMYQTFLQVDGEPCTVQVGLLLIRINVI
jgi:hypothetical protein